MLTTEHPRSATETSTPAAEYALRLLAGTDGERVISIPRGKHSIGSGPRCSLRLQYAGIQPLECLIVHDDEGLRVRRWSDATLVNGEPFDDVRLSAGDMLTLGPVDLEVVGPGCDEPLEDRGTPTEPMWHDEPAEVETTSESYEVPEVEEFEEVDEVEAGAAIEAKSQLLQPVDVNSDWDSVVTVSEAELTAEPVELETAAKPRESRRSRRLRAALRRQRREHDELAARVEDLTRKIEQALAEPAVAPLPMVVAQPEPTPIPAPNDEYKHQAEELTAELTTVRNHLATREAELERARYSIDVLERQLIDSQHTMHAFAEERVTWEEQFNQLESRLAEYVGRIQELELQLDQVRAAHAAMPQVAASETDEEASASQTSTALWADEMSNTETVVEEPLEAETVEIIVEPTLEQAPSEAAVVEEVVEGPSAEVAEVAVVDERVADDERIADEERVADEEQTADEQSTAEKIVVEEAAEPVTPVAEMVVQEAGVGEDEADVDAALEHLRGLSLWREEPAATEEASPEVASPAAVEELPASPAPAAESFIDRYSHLFPAEDDSVAPPAAPQRAVVEPAPVFSHEAQSTPEGHADEESVEQYMARLLERMRGPGAPTPSAEESTVVANASQLESTVVSEPEVVEPENHELITDLEELRSSVPAPERSHSMAAMRELANESARHAIGVHTARRLRRAARTQAIIALLGAAVGTYLLIEAPNWQTLQFAGGCVAGFVALYWGKLTLMTLIEGIRLGAFEHADDEIDPEKSLHPPLPIDIEPTVGEVEHPTVAEQESTYAV
jgi:hypothetical protein